MDGKKVNSFDILGVKISAINIDDAARFIDATINQKEKAYISVCPVSTIMECQKNPQALESVNSASLVTPDGMPVVWLGKVKKNRNVKRVYGPDLMLKVCEISQKKGYRNYFYGSTNSVLEKLTGNLKQKFPDLIISGVFSPPFGVMSAEEDEKNIQMINDSNSDILCVGLGSPKQDLWMHKHKDKINVPVMIGVGAAFDFISGTKKQAPKFVQRIGFEWLFRLICEPKRLWKRYVAGNTQFLYLITKELIIEKFGRKGVENER